jgi:hypothetical protein
MILLNRLLVQAIFDGPEIDDRTAAPAVSVFPDFDQFSAHRLVT